MKTIKSISLIFIVPLLALLPLVSSAQKVVHDTLRVEGNCEMCKERIEKALDVKGVRFADWNIQTKMLDIVYNPKKISEERIHAIINNAGHDTEKGKASDEAYKKLHPCCDYRYNPE